MYPVGANLFGLQNDRDVHLIETNNYNPIYGNIAPPGDLADGKLMRIIDIGSYLNITKISFLEMARL